MIEDIPLAGAWNWAEPTCNLRWRGRVLEQEWRVYAYPPNHVGGNPPEVSKEWRAVPMANPEPIRENSPVVVGIPYDPSGSPS